MLAPERCLDTLHGMPFGIQVAPCNLVVRSGGQAYVNDDLRDTAGDVVSWDGHIVHAVWIHSYLAGDRDCRPADTSDSSPPADLKQARNDGIRTRISQAGGVIC